VQDVVVDAMVSRHRGDRHAGNAASGNQLDFELGAVGAAATAGLGELVVGVHVSTICYEDTMLLDLGPTCQMGWPDAYLCLHRHAACICTGDDSGDCLRKQAFRAANLPIASGLVHHRQTRRNREDENRKKQDK
jgi:hypothetical protein